MGLVNKDTAVLSQKKVRLNFFEKNTVCHKLDASASGDICAIKSYLVTNQLTEFAAYFLTYSLRQRNSGNSSWLGYANHQS